MKRFSGFSLIEVVVSSALVASAVGAMFAVAATSNRLTIQGQDRLIASQLAREGIEIARQTRDVGYISGVCSGGTINCSAWYNGLLTDFAPGNPAIIVPTVKGISSNKVHGFSFVPVNLSGNACADYIVRDLTDGSVAITHTNPTLLPKQELFCRRVFIEPVDLPLTPANERTTLDALRIRSQVAWIGSGKNVLRIPGATLADNSCPAGSTEWCLDEIAILTNWRPSL